MFEIRNIQKSDIPTLVKLEEELLKETVGCEMLQSELHNQFAYFYVGVYDNEVIGYLSVWMVEETVDVINFVIDKRYQHKGYGREALKQGIEFIKSFPCGEAEYCWLSYEPNNEVGRKLYISMGFEERMDLYKNGGEIPAIFKL